MSLTASSLRRVWQRARDRRLTEGFPEHVPLSVIIGVKTAGSHMSQTSAETAILRVDTELWERATRHLVNRTGGETAGILLLRTHRPLLTKPDAPTLLTAVGYEPVRPEDVIDQSNGLTYDARFHLYAARRAHELSAGMLLMHAHDNDPAPEPSARDCNRGQQFLTFAVRRDAGQAHGLLVLGNGAVTATIVLDETELTLTEVRVVGERRSRLPALAWKRSPLHVRVGAHQPEPRDLDDDPDRQGLVFGAIGMRAIAGARVGIVGLSGGGSHVQQQLIHAGVGCLVVVDDESVSRTNLRRLVGAIAADIDRTKKVDVAVRTARAVRPEVEVISIEAAFPSAIARAGLRECDVIVGCLDAWDVRDALNEFALEMRIPYVDIGATIASDSADFPRVSGQVAVVLPGRACLRDMRLVTDARVEQSRQRQLGYLESEPEPQVVSINGTLASDAVTAVLLLLATSSAPICARRRYSYPPGKLAAVETRLDPDCPSCRRAGLR